jgi:hypothetical protein
MITARVLLAIVGMAATSMATLLAHSKEKSEKAEKPAKSEKADRPTKAETKVDIMPRDERHKHICASS